MEHGTAHGSRRAAERVALLGRIASATDTALRDAFGAGDLCIVGARIVRDVARRCGLRAEVLPTRVAVWNGVWIDFVARHGRVPATLAESQALMEQGGWCVAVGAGYLDDREAPFGYHPERGSYNGHLVAVIEDRWLVDPTLGQTADPARGIVTGPLVTELPGAPFAAGAEHLAGCFRWQAHPLVHVTYEAVPQDRSYRAVPAWNAREAAVLVAAMARSLMPAEPHRRTAVRRSGNPRWYGYTRSGRCRERRAAAAP